MAQTTKTKTTTAAPSKPKQAKPQVPVIETASPAPASAATRACPTRLDGGDPLFQHRVTASQCATKQKAQYHKCFTCAHGCNG